MAVASFEVFCADLCALIGTPVPPLEADASGLVGFTMEYRGATVGFIKPDESKGAGILMMITFGVPPPEVEHAVLRVLMEGNYLMMGMNAPAYARNPLTGEISLHYNIPLLQANSHAVLGSIEQAALMTQHFRRTWFLEEAGGATVPPAYAQRPHQDAA